MTKIAGIRILRPSRTTIGANTDAARLEAVSRELGAIWHAYRLSVAVDAATPEPAEVLLEPAEKVGCIGGRLRDVDCAVRGEGVAKRGSVSGFSGPL